MHHLHRRLWPSRTLETPGRRRRVSTIALTPVAACLVLASAGAAQADTTRSAATAPQSTSAERRLNPQSEPPGVAAVRRRSPDVASSAKSPTADPWRRVVTKRYTHETLGLGRDASARVLARAAIERSARSLGVRRRAGIRFASEFAAPAARAGARRLRTLRFRQTMRGLRVLWSEIDVAVVDGAVTSISATTVPFTQTKLLGRRRVTRARARAIAKRAQPGAEHALPAQPVAYAGTPAKSWAPRRAWVVQLQPAKQDRGADAAETICVVVDAASGKVLMRYKGFASQNAGRRDAAPPARSASATTPFISLFDARRTTGLGDLFARWIGDPRPGGSFRSEVFVSDLLSRDGARQAFLSSAAVVKAACQRGFCPAYTVIHGKVVKGQTIITNSSDPIGSHYSPTGSIITLKTGDADNDDVLAHELGHRRDHEWADDRVDGHQQVEEVEEALADMFAYDFDHDPVHGEDFSIDYPGDLKKTDKLRHLAVPSAYDIDGAPYPSTMSQYRCAPDTDPHINATILGHAYYLFAKQVGHEVAGNVLTYIPDALPVVPNFNDVAYWFAKRSQELYSNPAIAAAASTAFRTQAGIGTQTPAGKGCGSGPPLNPPNPPSDLACEKQNPPPSCFPGPPTRPELDPTE